MTSALARHLALLALALVVGGCGTSERVAYERDLAAVGRSVDAALARMPQDDTSTLGPGDVNSLADDLRETADQLADLDAPEDVEEPQRRLERGLRGVAKAFEDLARQLGSAETDEDKAELFVKFATDEQIDAAFDDVIGAQEAYASKGYRVFGSEGDDASVPAD